MKSFISFVVIAFFILVSSSSGTGCANIIPPEGGPRDSLPPALRKASPPDSSLNFDSKSVLLSFDEFVDADNYLQEMIVSPVPASMPVITRKLNSVTIKLRDTLEPNTTYTINLGNTIKDVNEGNPLKNFTYTFSTGRYIDSLEFTGNVVLAETGDIDSTLTVLLHKTNSDSAVLKDKPRYVTRLDNKGSFHFKNLPPGTFYVYALKDEGGSYRYMNPEQLFAFCDAAIIINDSVKQVTLYAYSDKNIKSTTQRVSTTGDRSRRQTDKRLKFTTSLSGEKQDLLEQLTISFETNLKSFDSSKISFLSDTTFSPVTGYRWEMDSTMKKLALSYPWQSGKLYHLILEKDFATDSLNQQLLKKDTLSFRAKEKNEYGKLTIRFRNLDLAQNPVLLFVLNNEVKKSFPLTSINFSQELFPPGDYNLRILNDRNKNGIWDPGVFYGKRQQPELVKQVQRSVNIKPNLDNSFDIDITATPPKENNTRTQQNNPRIPGRLNSNRPGNQF